MAPEQPFHSPGTGPTSPGNQGQKNDPADKPLQANTSQTTGRNSPNQAENKSNQKNTAGSRPVPQLLPAWKVILHNDSVNDLAYVIHVLEMVARLNTTQAKTKAVEAHTQGLSIVTTTHQELAELYLQQLTHRKLTVTIEPADKK